MGGDYFLSVVQGYENSTHRAYMTHNGLNCENDLIIHAMVSAIFSFAVLKNLWPLCGSASEGALKRPTFSPCIPKQLMLMAPLVAGHQAHH